MKKLIYCTVFFFVLAGTSALFAQNIKKSKTHLKAAVVVNFKQLADYQAKHPAKVKKHFIEQGEDREKEFKFKGRPIPADAIRANVELPARPDGTSGVRTTSPAPYTSFNGILDNGSTIPPDIRGAAGITYVMQTTNQEFKVYSKTGTLITSLDIDNFFTAGGGQPGSYFDPHVSYDTIRNRYVVCIGGNLSNGFSGVFLAVSETTDPLANWFIYEIDGTGNTSDLLDYPLIGYNQNWVVITGNDFTSSGTKAKIFVMNRDSVYSGGSGAVTTFTDNNSFTLAPAQTNDSTQMVEYMVENENGNGGSHGYVRISRITGTPNTPVYTRGTVLGINFPWSDNNVGVPQNGSANLLEDGDTRISNAVYINGTMWFSHTVYLPASAPTRDGVDWWQVDPAVPSVIQFGRIEDQAGVNFYFYPSINVNYQGDALVGYCTSSANTFASAAYSFRAVGDPLNTMEDTYIYKNGLDVYFKTFGGSRNRWGDYTSTAVDPVNNSFWNFSEWANTSNRWGTVIANVLSSNDTVCYAPVNALARNLTDTSVDLSWVSLAGTQGFVVQYREVGSSTWSIVPAGTTALSVAGLTGSTQYEWQVQSICASGDSSSFTPSDTFLTHVTCSVADPIGIPGLGCNGSSVTLGAAGTSVLTWFDAASGGTALDTGSTFITPVLTANTTYYVESDEYSACRHVGPADSTLGGIGTGGFTTIHNYKNVVFDCFSPVRIVSVLIYALGTGNRTIALRQNGIILQSRTMSIPDGASRVTLDFDVPVGVDFELGIMGNINLYRNTTGAAYPYTLSGTISITGNNTAPENYFFFYDWELQEPPCKSNRVPVLASVQSSLAADYTMVTNLDTVTFTGQATGATHWLWNFGDAASGTNDTSTLQNPVHIFSSPDSAYTVCLTATDSGTACNDTSCKTILIGPVRVAGILPAKGISVFPNPVKDMLVIDLGKSATPGEWKVRITDLPGQLIEERITSKSAAGKKMQLDMSKLAAGVYVVTVQNEKEVLVRQVVKE